MTKLSISALAAAFALAAPFTALAATPVHISKAQALKEIRTDGYTDAKDLRAEKGGWTAKAMEGGKSVSLFVDPTGGVRKM